jgi:hypothetical protein
MMKVAGLAVMAGVVYTIYYFFPELRRYMRVRSM